MEYTNDMITSDYEMLMSCYTYHDLGSKYVDELIKKYGKAKIDREIQILQDNFRVETNVYEDGEGCTYNQLVRI